MFTPFVSTGHAQATLGNRYREHEQERRNIMFEKMVLYCCFLFYFIFFILPNYNQYVVTHEQYKLSPTNYFLYFLHTNTSEKFLRTSPNIVFSRFTP